MSCKLNFARVSSLFWCLFTFRLLLLLCFALFSASRMHIFHIFKLHFPLDVIIDANNYRKKGRPIAGVAKVLCQRGWGGEERTIEK